MALECLLISKPQTSSPTSPQSPPTPLTRPASNPDLSTPGIRIPLTTNPALFREAVELGGRILWLHTFGERMADAVAGRQAGPPRVQVDPPSIPLAGRIPSTPADFPDLLNYDAAKHRLLVGQGYVENVIPQVWAYGVSGKQVLSQWFSYRKLHSERPVIGDRRPPSKLNEIQPDHWLPEYTAELLNVLTLLVALEPAQADLLDRICDGPLLSNDELAAPGAFTAAPAPVKAKKCKRDENTLFKQKERQTQIPLPNPRTVFHARFPVITEPRTYLTCRGRPE